MTSSETRKLTVGSKVWCIVTGCSGWYSIIEIRQRDGYIRVRGFKPFCPPHNFTIEPKV